MSPSTLGAGPGLITTAVKRILGSLATWWMPRYCFTLGNARWPPCEFANHSSTNHSAVHLVINYIPKVSQSPYMSELRVWSPSPPPAVPLQPRRQPAVPPSPWAPAARARQPGKPMGKREKPRKIRTLVLNCPRWTHISRDQCSVSCQSLCDGVHWPGPSPSFSFEIEMTRRLKYTKIPIYYWEIWEIWHFLPNSPRWPIPSSGMLLILWLSTQKDVSNLRYSTAWPKENSLVIIYSMFFCLGK